MKKYFISLSIALAAIISTACNGQKEEEVTVYPVSALVVNVGGADYTALPELNGEEYTTNLKINVFAPAATAVVKSIAMAHEVYTASIAEGDVLTFVNDVATFTITKKGVATTYSLMMVYTTPAMLYMVKTSDKNNEGNRYFFNSETVQHLASLATDGKFEGYIDLTATDWDNVGFVREDKLERYDVAAGPWPALSYIEYTLEAHECAEEEEYFVAAGPWNNWKVTNDNAAIVSPGVWRFTFDASTLAITGLQTQWAVSGSAIADATAMTYSSKTKLWTLQNQALSAGVIKFSTIAVTEGDPTVVMGDRGSTSVTGFLMTGGANIEVEAGNYDITLNLSNAPYYSYTLTKK